MDPSQLANASTAEGIGDSEVGIHPRVGRREKTLTILAAAGIGLAVAAAHVRPSAEMIGDLGRSLAAGVILGSGVWPYSLSSVPPELQSTPLLSFSTCDWRGQCGIYGLASATFVDGWADTAYSE